MAFAGSRAAVDVRPHRAGNLVLRAAPAARYGEFCGALRALACRQHGLVGLHKLVSVNRFEDRYKT